MGDLNADMGNAIGDKSTREPTGREENCKNSCIISICVKIADTFFQPVSVPIQPLTTFFYQLAGLKRFLMQKRFACLLIILLIMCLFKQIPIYHLSQSSPWVGFINIMKIKWNDCPSTEILKKYVSPLTADLK